MPLSQLFRREAAVDPDPPRARTDSSGGPAKRPSADSVFEKADALDERGLHWEALSLLDDALTRSPDDPLLYFRRGATLFHWGRIYESRDSSLHAAQLGLATEALYRQICWCFCQTGSPDEGAKWMDKALQVAPGDWRVQFGAAILANIGKRFDEAVEHLERVLSLAPGSALALNYLALIHIVRTDFAAAERSARCAIEADPREAMAWANLGVALGRQLRFDEAWPAFERALELEAETGCDLDAFVNYCGTLGEAGRTQDAIELYERFLATVPSASGQGDYAFALLTVGRIVEGWKQYEFRWASNTSVRRFPRLAGPMWNGQDLRGRTILLWVEQGIGDIIQFVRYAALVKALGARVILVGRQEFGRMLHRCPGIDAVVWHGEELPAFDFQCPIMSLPRVFGTTVETIPARIPYLRASAEKVDEWRPRLPPSSKRRVGIVWAGSPNHPNDRNRSIPLSSLRPLLSCDGVAFISLQKGPASAQLGNTAAEFEICDIGNDLQDLEDTLAVVEQLDLIICVDTSVAHLAGAAGAPTWLLLPRQADFRWLEGRTDSPWYPSIRLFRQDTLGDWTGTVGRVADALGAWASGDAPPEPAPKATATTPASWHGMADIEAPDPEHRPGFSEIAYTRHGMLQYLPETPFEGASLRIYGEYLQGQVQLVQSLISQDAMVLDVHSGIGAQTIAIAQMIGPGGHVLAFEPDKRRHRVLRRNLAANGVGNVTTLYRDVSAEASPGAGRKLHVQDVQTSGISPTPEGAVDTVDGLRLLRLGLLKVNAGANVRQVLEGAGETLWRCRPRLLIAVPDRTAAGLACEQMRGFGYRCWLHEAPYYAADNFNRIDRDVFRGVTALAVVGVPEEVDLDLPPQYCYEMS
jgi:FkbM family methyltransferase